MKKTKISYKKPDCKVISMNVRQQILTGSTEWYGISENNYGDLDWH